MYDRLLARAVQSGNQLGNLYPAAKHLWQVIEDVFASDAAGGLDRIPNINPRTLGILRMKSMIS